MIYNLILFKHYDSFATVKITGIVRAGDNVRFKDLLYKIVEIDGSDITVIL